MIQAIKSDSLTTVNVITLQVRLKELDQFKNCFVTMATTSALLSGFSYGSMSTTTWSTKAPELLKIAYMIMTTTSMAFGLLTILTSSFCSMLGPGLALRGTQGHESINKAVDTMRDEFNQTLKYFLITLLTFQVSVFFKMFLVYRISIALSINAILVVFLIYFIKKGLYIFDILHVEDHNAMTG